MLIKFDAVDLDELFCCFVFFAAFANAGVDASSSPCLTAFAKLSALLLFELSLTTFASGSALLAFAFAALPNAVGDGVGGVVGTFT